MHAYNYNVIKKKKKKNERSTIGHKYIEWNITKKKLLYTVYSIKEFIWVNIFISQKYNSNEKRKLLFIKGPSFAIYIHDYE